MGSGEKWVRTGHQKSDKRYTMLFVDFEIDVLTAHRGAKFVFSNSKRNDDANTGSCTAAKS